MSDTDPQTAEPAGWRYRHEGGKWTVQKNKPHWFRDFMKDVELEPLYASAAKVVGWVNEDELPEGYPYDAMFPYSKVDGVRLFPVFAPASHKAGGE